ncbi:hypothetical protein Ddye_003654 [Dipteronia dyeriana]|uniref:Uncharacterized protein n=1 Tax=Dipteronia dyeriana TaxID=168575 RepID=A0AAE0CVJ3_9ROSI|nr:hypothetical protein Ddye_003654 [Dipteronia dyeriana]
MAFQVAGRTWDRFQHRIMSTTSRAAFANTVRLHYTHNVSVAFKLLHTVHRNSWTAATTTTSFPDGDRLRTRPEDEGGLDFDFDGVLTIF